MHYSTFEYLAPTDEQRKEMEAVRTAFANFAVYLDSMLPEGPDKTYALRKLREVGMWCNVTITRTADGTPRV